MSTPTRKHKRLETRVTPEQKELFLRAASLQGRSLTDFVVSSLQETATRVIAGHDQKTHLIPTKSEEINFTTEVFHSKPSLTGGLHATTNRISAHASSRNLVFAGNRRDRPSRSPEDDSRSR